jgi:protein kinase-like protein/WD40 repeat protein
MTATNAGIILGTAAYMSPEQAKGRHVDKRADIWAFGVVLYELLTGKPAFQGEDVTETLAAVVMKDPDLSIVPAKMRLLLQKCLQKNPKNRLRDIADAWELIDARTSTPVRTDSRFKSKVASLAAAALALALAVLAFVHFSETPPAPLTGLFNISLPHRSSLNYIMLAPNGGDVAFVSDEGGPARLWVRPLDSLEARPIAGTEGATFPFWSPDGKNIGFFAQGKLKKIALAGGPAEVLCDAPTPRGGTWNRDGVIVFAPNIGGGLFRVPADGGVPVSVTKFADTGNGGRSDGGRYPEFIDGGNRFLFLINPGQAKMPGIYIGSLDGSEPVRLLPDDSHAIYVPPTSGAATGSLLFVRDTTAMALPFDADRLRAVGPAVPVAQDLLLAGTAGFGIVRIGKWRPLVSQRRIRTEADTGMARQIRQATRSEK